MVKRDGGAPRRGGIAEMPTKFTEDAMEDVLTDFTLDELREFLEADLHEVPANPDFKEGLRRKLWELVRGRFGPAG